MNLTESVKKTVKTSEFFLRKNAPTILTGVGVVGFTATVALAIKATTKVVEVRPELDEEVQIVKQRIADTNYSEHERMEDLIKVHLANATKLTKIYGPTLVVGSASIVALLAAHGLMLKRQASLLAAYTALDAGYKAYRIRVAEKLGDEEELKLYRAPTIVENKKGEACEIDMDEVLPSPYARFFDESSRNWTKTPEYNLMFLRSQQDWANDRLNAYGFIFLNEVYEALGLERSQAGQMVGWKRDKGNGGDGFVDFGIYDIADECNRAFVNGIEHTVLLDFNVDGPIKI